ncbi:hypothetical protein GGI19_002967 [Coemansia pectinata]|uniref:Uncharacterized protein n=1 Tax=Coemansia pectinata TaxID=1052879 RepID=A0A9W8LAS3_9FUNG|nr:hypothetical protein GGI19_002967 [Coemansia pectinata]
MTVPTDSEIEADVTSWLREPIRGRTPNDFVAKSEQLDDRPLVPVYDDEGNPYIAPTFRLPPPPPPVVPGPLVIFRDTEERPRNVPVASNHDGRVQLLVRREDVDEDRENEHEREKLRQQRRRDNPGGEDPANSKPPLGVRKN